MCSNVADAYSANTVCDHYMYFINGSLILLPCKNKTQCEKFTSVCTHTSVCVAMWQSDLVRKQTEVRLMNCLTVSYRASQTEQDQHLDTVEQILTALPISQKKNQLNCLHEL